MSARDSVARTLDAIAWSLSEVRLEQARQRERLLRIEGWVQAMAQRRTLDYHNTLACGRCGYYGPPLMGEDLACPRCTT